MFNITFRPKISDLAEPGRVRIVFLHDNRTMTWEQLLTDWENIPEFRECFNTALAEIPYQAFRWETPAVTVGCLQVDFECVVLDSSVLDRPADWQTFADHFVDHSSVVTFPNLGGDAMLVVPCPSAQKSADAHGYPIWQRLSELLRRNNATAFGPAWPEPCETVSAKVRSG